MIDQLGKYKAIDRIICCPNCKGPVVVNADVLFDDIAFHGSVSCPTCGDVGRVDNLKYAFNETPLASEQSASRKLSGQLQIVPLPLSGGVCSPPDSWQADPDGRIHTNGPDARLTFTSDAEALGLVFLKHPHSGIVRISVDGVRQADVDLFESAGSMQYWHPVLLDGTERLVEIEPIGRNNEAQGAQVWLLEAEELKVAPDQAPAILSRAQNKGNPYPESFASLLEALPRNALILDCGSGDRCHEDPRVVNFEYSRFQCPEVFGDGHFLPFKDNSFDLVLSQAVMEHVYDPFLAAREIVRVLKPGGTLYCESAFMQPLHAVPFHFFNTTVWGIAKLFEDLEDVRVDYAGTLTETLEWIYRDAGVREKGFGPQLDQLLRLSAKLDAHISHQELRGFASFVTLTGFKRQ